MAQDADSPQQERGRTRRQSESREALRVALDTARDELLAAVALIPAAERSTRPVCGAWTVKDLLGHIADWERIGAEGLRLMAAGRAPTIELIKDIEAWNQIHARARHGEPWEMVWSDLHTTRRELLEILAGMSSRVLGQCFPFTWGGEGTACEWVSIFARHDQEHAADLQTAGY